MAGRPRPPPWACGRRLPLACGGAGTTCLRTRRDRVSVLPSPSQCAPATRMGSRSSSFQVAQRVTRRRRASSQTPPPPPPSARRRACARAVLDTDNCHYAAASMAGRPGWPRPVRTHSTHGSARRSCHRGLAAAPLIAILAGMIEKLSGNRPFVALPPDTVGRREPLDQRDMHGSVHGPPLYRASAFCFSASIKVPLRPPRGVEHGARGWACRITMKSDHLEILTIRSGPACGEEDAASLPNAISGGHAARRLKLVQRPISIACPVW